MSNRVSRMKHLRVLNSVSRRWWQKHFQLLLAERTQVVIVVKIVVLFGSCKNL